MHVLQWIATKAEDKEQAYTNVEQHLESQMSGNDAPSTWYDWFVVGGGRWNTGEDDNFDEAYKNGKTNMIISLAEDEQAFMERIDKCLEYRISEFNDYRESFNKASIDLNERLDSYTGVMQYDFELYPLKKMIDMLNGEWDFNAYFWDSENWSTNPEHMKKDVSGSWYIVPVDFHF